MRNINNKSNLAFFPINEDMPQAPQIKINDDILYDAALLSLENTLGGNLSIPVRNAGLEVLQLVKSVNAENPNKKPVLINALVHAGEAIKNPIEKNINGLDIAAREVNRVFPAQGIQLCRQLFRLGIALVIFGTILNCHGLIVAGIPITIVGALLAGVMGVILGIEIRASRPNTPTGKLNTSMQALGTTLHAKNEVSTAKNSIAAPIAGLNSGK